MNAQTLRWFYGLVIDPYPLTIRRADGRVIVEEVQGDAWSRTIDLSGQFHAPLLSQRTVGIAIAALLLSRCDPVDRANHESTKTQTNRLFRCLCAVVFVRSG